MTKRIHAFLLCLVIAVSLCTPTKAADEFNRIEGTHTYLDDARAVNPRYYEDAVYRENCTHSVAAYEMRRRGWDVEATGAKEDDIYRHDWTSTWGLFGSGVFLGGDDPLLDIEKVILYAGDGARYEICLEWNAAKGHVIVGENIDGEVVWIDPQRGKAGTSVRDLFNRAENAWYVRIDDLAINMAIMQDLCVNSTPYYDPLVNYMALMEGYAKAGDTDGLLVANKARNAKIAAEKLPQTMLTDEEALQRFMGVSEGA